MKAAARFAPTSGRAAAAAPGRTAALAALAAVGLVAACAPSPEPGVTSAEHAAPRVPFEQAAEQAAGKPLAAFALDYEIDGVPAVGTPLVLRVTLRPQSRLEDVTVEISADDGLHIDSDPTRFTAAAVTPDALAEWAVDVVPVAEGRFLVRIFAEGFIDGSHQARSVVAPIRVGRPVAAADAQAPVGADGSDAAAAAASRVQAVDGSGRTSGPSGRKGPAGEEPIRTADKAPQQETRIRLPAVERR